MPKIHKRNLPAKIGRLIWRLLQKPGKLHKVSMLANFFADPYGNPFGIIFDRQAFLESGGFDLDFFPSPDWINEIMFHLKYNFYIYREKLYIYNISPEQNNLRALAAKSIFGEVDNYPYLCIATFFDLPKYLKYGKLFWKVFGKDFEKYKKYWDTGEKSHYSRLYWIMYYIMINNWS
jgi:hypothetical protein